MRLLRCLVTGLPILCSVKLIPSVPFMEGLEAPHIPPSWLLGTVWVRSKTGSGYVSSIDKTLGVEVGSDCTES